MTKLVFMEVYEIKNCMPPTSGYYLVQVEDGDELKWKIALYNASRQLFDTAHITKWAKLPEED